jgi:preprotein translocase subunit SecG
MQLLLNLLLAVQILAALAMIGLVLIQHGKGADMGASFGSGSSGSLFGATGSANFLSRATAACATVFFVCTLALAYFGVSRSGAVGGGTSALDQPAMAASAASPSASAAIPGVVAASAAAMPVEAAASAAAEPASGNAQIPGR